ncbi:hypothetical protein BGZ63DRAFT_377423 [Mariannaea sp. PMI_226]|nr:hypothetical protein BGZ63DRAFT_377423 [Mariannaea sp. PMI_226]
MHRCTCKFSQDGIPTWGTLVGTLGIVIPLPGISTQADSERNPVQTTKRYGNRSGYTSGLRIVIIIIIIIITITTTHVRSPSLCLSCWRLIQQLLHCPTLGGWPLER